MRSDRNLTGPPSGFTAELAVKQQELLGFTCRFVPQQARETHPMASYKDASRLLKNESDAFDKTHRPGSAAAYAGIYRCSKCGHEIAIAQGHTLPPQSHPQHPESLGTIEWQLIVFAMHNNAK